MAINVKTWRVFSVKKRDAELSTHFANRNSPFEKSAFLKKRGLERKGFKRIRFISKESRAFEKRLSKKASAAFLTLRLHYYLPHMQNPQMLLKVGRNLATSK